MHGMNLIYSSERLAYHETNVRPQYVVFVGPPVELSQMVISSL